MKLKKTLTVLISFALAITILAVNASAYFFAVGGKPVTVTLDVGGASATATLSTSADLETCSIIITGCYLKTDGSTGTTSTTAYGSGSYLSCTLNLPTDGVKWTEQVVAEFSATYNNDSSGTSITKLL